MPVPLLKQPRSAGKPSSQAQPRLRGSPPSGPFGRPASGRARPPCRQPWKQGLRLRLRGDQLLQETSDEYA
eukprot:13957376-Alexandrium_andersonii.AAC.1